MAPIAYPGTADSQFQRGQRSVWRFLSDQQGEMGPATYIGALMLTLWFMFFALDLGLRKAAQVSVEYAAFCAARAAAVNFNTYTNGKKSCDAAAAEEAAARAAAGCLASVVSKRAIPDPTKSGAVSQLVDRAQQQVAVTLDSDCSSNTNVVTAQVRYTYQLKVPLSPLSSQKDPTVMTARAQFLIY